MVGRRAHRSTAARQSSCRAPAAARWCHRHAAARPPGHPQRGAVREDDLHLRVGCGWNLHAGWARCRHGRSQHAHRQEARLGHQLPAPQSVPPLPQQATADLVTPSHLRYRRTWIIQFSQDPQLLLRSPATPTLNPRDLISIHAPVLTDPRKSARTNTEQGQPHSGRRYSPDGYLWWRRDGQGTAGPPDRLGATTSWMVDQLANGRMRRLAQPASASGVTSGTTRGMSGSIRKAEEWSITMQPAATARFPYLDAIALRWARPFHRGGVRKSGVIRGQASFLTCWSVHSASAAHATRK